MRDTAHARQVVADAGRVLSAAGLTELHTGHVSDRREEFVLIPSHRHDEGRGLESLTPEHVVAVDLSGTPVDASGDPLPDPDVEPPSEFPIHAAVFEARPDVRSVVHAHPTHATALSATGQSLVPATLDATLFEAGVPLFDPGPELIHDAAGGEALAAELGGANALLIRGHGAVTTGRSVAAATARMYLLERAARLQVLAEQAGGARPFEGVERSEGYLAESERGFFDEVFAHLRRRYLGREPQ